MSEEMGIVVGRFQPFHNGHGYLLDQVQEEYEEVLVGIGTSKDPGNGNYLIGDPDNPLDYDTRAEMIRRGFDEISLYDVRDENHPPTWIDKIEKLMDIEAEERESITAITGNHRTADCFRWAGYQVDELAEEDLKQPQHLSGDTIRDLAAKDDPEWMDRVPEYTLEVLSDRDIDLGARIRQAKKEEEKRPNWVMVEMEF